MVHFHNLELDEAGSFEEKQKPAALSAIEPERVGNIVGINPGAFPSAFQKLPNPDVSPDPRADIFGALAVREPVPTLGPTSD
jgi:hypothetical protein